MTLREAAAGVAGVDVIALPRAAELPAQQVVFDGLYTNTDRGYLARIRGLLRVTPEAFAELWQPQDWEAGWQALSLTVTPTALDRPAVANALHLTATNLGSVTLDAGRMRLAPGAPVGYSVQTDGPIAIRFSDGRLLELPAGQHDGILH